MTNLPLSLYVLVLIGLKKTCLKKNNYISSLAWRRHKGATLSQPTFHAASPGARAMHTGILDCLGWFFSGGGENLFNEAGVVAKRTIRIYPAIT